MYVHRTLERFVTGASQQFPVVLLTGARQVGKTTLLRHLSQGKRAHVTLDDPLVMSLARADPALFMQRFPPPVLIDERFSSRDGAAAVYQDGRRPHRGGGGPSG